ncbi:hypothetical protein [Roseovarius atlanticus]|uniref:hypothetical protein n=1 Tax=Roseovarius atlanticus TaxID=1641875 RepID=UPI001C98593A|nr:hypothetical protein [Roseovarius atlanticus]MBY5988227.1 hypothetical protein [Roseovarius atlanticus]MBY6123618.1 hypothetical protein [Roseovarius atlanticus]MBY6148113.1 hypothetical protein [Roseovarius atlanticus]
MTRAELRKLARRGKLIDTCYKVFADACFPGAPPDQRATMRICFFAGAAELFAVMNAGLDDGTNETDGDLAFMEQWVNELESFHEKTIAALMATGKKH